MKRLFLPDKEQISEAYLIASVILIFVTIILGFVFTDFLGRHALRTTIAENELVLDSIAHYMQDEIEEIEHGVKIMSSSQGLQDLLKEDSPGNRTKAYDVLERYNDGMMASVSYIMDINGKVVASTNRNDPDSFEGKNYGFRKYFKDALNGGLGNYFALGITSGKKGFYAGYPIYDNKHIIGVAVIKKELDDIEDRVSKVDTCFLLNEKGVVFISSDPDDNFKIFWPVDDNIISDIVNSRQFGDGPFIPKYNHVFEEKKLIRLNGKFKVFLRKNIAGKSWEIALIADAERVILYRIIGIVPTLIVVIILIAFIIIITLINNTRLNLQFQKDRVELMFKLTPSAIFTVDRNGIVTSWNKKAEEVTGYTAGEIVGKDCRTFALSPCTDRCGLFSENVIKPIVAKECKIKKKNGEVLTILKNSDVVIDEKGNIIGGIESFEDITYIKKIENDLKISEERMNFAMEAINEGIWDFYPIDNRLILSPRWYTMLGYEPYELPQDYSTWAILLHPDDKEDAVAIVEDFLKRKQENFSIEVRMKAKNGTWRWINSRAKTVERDEDGRVRRMVGTHSDITERKVFEKQILDLSKFSSENPNPILRVNWEKKVLYANYPATEILGLSGKEEKYLGSPWAGLIDELRTSSVKNINIETIEDEKIYSWFIVKVEHQDYYNIYGIDITERKLAEIEREQAMKVKSQFTSMVSHELRTPLGPIKEGASLILDGVVGETNDQQKDLLEMIKRNASRLTRLINDVLDFQKLESGKMEFRVRENNINECIEEIHNTMIITAKDKGLSFDLDLDGAIDEAHFDRDKITQVLSNLVNNALKFTQTGGITIKSMKESDSIHVAVTDTGLGIKDEEMDKLFHSFQQLGSSRAVNEPGTGLGLAICKEIIDKHGGKIWAESVFEKGSTFHFIIPI